MTTYPHEDDLFLLLYRVYPMKFSTGTDFQIKTKYTSWNIFTFHN